MQPQSLPRHTPFSSPLVQTEAPRERFTRIESRNYQELTRDESWIEVSSQPSDDSCSTSSSEIILEGLVVQSAPGAQQRIRKKRKGPASKNISSGQLIKGKVCDKDADDLSEAEALNPELHSGGSSDPASSVEQLPKQEDMDSSSSAAGEESDSPGNEGAQDSDEDAGTLLGTGCRTGPTRPSSFTSQYPRSQQQSGASGRAPSTNFYPHPRSPTAGSSSGTIGRYSHYSRHPSTKKSHDEALMASLSTLLSCAAAARALPKAVTAQQETSRSPAGQNRAGTVPSSRVQLDTLHLVPDRLMGDNRVSVTGASTVPSGMSSTDSTANTSTRYEPTSSLPTSALEPSNSPTISKRKSSLPSTASDTESSHKRRASPEAKSPSPRRSHSPRSTRKASSLLPLPLDESLNVSLLTLAFGAGAVVVLSAVAFSAGYALGKEVGKSEAEAMGEALGNATRRVINEGARGSGRGFVGGVGRRVVSVSA